MTNNTAHPKAPAGKQPGGKSSSHFTDDEIKALARRLVREDRERSGAGKSAASSTLGETARALGAPSLARRVLAELRPHPLAGFAEKAIASLRAWRGGRTR